MKPIVSMDKEGKAIIFGNTFSQQSNMVKVINHIKEIAHSRTIWNYIVLHANNPGSAGWYIEKMKTITGKKPAAVVNISPVIGSNAGIGAVSVAFMYN